jgi:uncharacterized protein YegJ (DUF2314 family)
VFGFFKKKRQSSEDENNVASLSADDTALQSYQEKAQQELPYLIQFMADNEVDEKLFRYAAKTNFTEGDLSEHMWVQVKEFKDGYFIGNLVNKPATMKLIKYGDSVKVLRADVEDWILEDFLTRTKVGGFSSAYIRNSAEQKERKSD